LRSIGQQLLHFELHSRVQSHAFAFFCFLSVQLFLWHGALNPQISMYIPIILLCFCAVLRAFAYVSSLFFCRLWTRIVAELFSAAALNTGTYSLYIARLSAASPAGHVCTEQDFLACGTKSLIVLSVFPTSSKSWLGLAQWREGRLGVSLGSSSVRSGRIQM